ncbi:MAG: 5'-methylthioadenosine/adenosylhomocysteine nucleosidase [Oscillospiraceae bacterium]|jgi:adenosylhomocysteine nucleosidase|nr:5'-methylthioadenosine/adenosylhomocysteine nucleosidase [Oscillospiraceae bacterium]
MVWGIIAALDAELALITRAMKTERVERICGADFHLGKIGENAVIAVCSSIGTINAAVCTTVLIRELGAQCVVNIGVAGSLSPSLRILDVVLGSELIFHDADLDIIEKYYPFRRSFTADPSLLGLAQKSIEALPHDYRCVVGPIASGDRFVADTAAKEDIASRCSCLCVEMEGAAVGQVAHMNGVPFLIIRSLSDDASEQADASYDNFLDLAALNSAGIVLEMIRRS